MTTLSKAIYRFDASPITMTFLTKTENPKTYIETQKTQNNQSNAEEKRVGGHKDQWDHNTLKHTIKLQ